MRAQWYKLDNVGKFYAAQAGNAAQTVFRFSATLKEPVDPDILQKALIRAIYQYPNFNVQLRSGLFWHYLESMQEIARVEKETLPICFPLHTDVSSSLYRVSYYDCRINLEVSHIISDGRGTLEFFKALICAYIEERYGNLCKLQDKSISQARLSEDSYTVNFDREAAGADKKCKVYRLAGWKNTTNPTYMEYHVSAAAVHTTAKSFGVSVTSFVIAAVMKAIVDTMPEAKSPRTINIGIPVDLRTLFESDTTRNFFGMAYVSLTPTQQHQPIEEIAKNVHVQLKEATQPDAIKRRMNRMIKFEKNPLIRVTPLFLKDAFLGIADWKSWRDVTTTVSNIGRIELDPLCKPYVCDINVLTSTRGLNFVLCTYGDDLSLGISSVYIRHDIIRRLCEILRDFGIVGTMNINKSCEQIDLQLKQARLESALDTHKPSSLREDEK